MQEIKLPQLGQSVEDAEITQWLKKEGDAVAHGEPIFTIQTDKAEIECESTAAGVLRKIIISEGIEVPVLTVVALVGQASEALPDLSQYAVSREVAPIAPATNPAPVTVPEPVVVAAPGDAISPRARSAAQRLRVNPTSVTATGPRGRIVERDVIAYDQARVDVRATPTARRVAREHGIDITAFAQGAVTGRPQKDDALATATSPRSAASTLHTSSTAYAAPLPNGVHIPLTPMRRIIAERMVQSKFSAPHFYIIVEVDMKEAVNFRGALPNFKPSFNDLIMLATSRAIQAFPTVNAKWLRTNPSRTSTASVRPWRKRPGPASSSRTTTLVVPSPCRISAPSAWIRSLRL